MTLGLAVLVPLVAAGGAFLAPRSLTGAFGGAGALASAAATVAVVAAIAADGPREVALGGWPAPLGIGLRADGLSAVMLAMTAVIGLAVSGYAVSSLPAGSAAWRPGHAFWPLWLILWAALNAAFLAGDAFNIYVALELVTLPAVALVALERKREALAAAMRYLLAALLGSMAYLLGVALLYSSTATLDLMQIADRIEPGTAAAVAIAAMTVGLMVKAALFPLHFWLPGAHASAPAPVSAALSGLVVTAAAYLVLRLWLYALTPAVTVAAAEVAGVLGAGAIVWGSVQALRAARLKLLIAYSTIAQVGYLFVLLALLWEAGAGERAGAVAAGSAAWEGGVYHAVAHAIAKAALFLAAGSVIASVGNDRFGALTGLAAHLPVTVAAIAIAAVSLAGLPPSGGFTAKWLMLVGAVDAGAWWWAFVLVLGGLLAAAYMLRLVLPAFRRGLPPENPRPVPRAMEAAALGLALVALALGLRGEELVSLLDAGERA